MNQTQCRKNDAIIQRKIDRGIWRPSLDTGHIYSTEKHANLNETINNSGYSYVGKRDLLVSRIIWIAAHGIPEPNMEVDHINGNKQDNRLENLQLVTPSENRQKSIGALTYQDAQDIRKAYQNGQTKTSLARQYLVSHRTIDRIVTNKTYKTKPPHEQNALLAQQQIKALEPETLTEICEKHAHGASFRQIADQFHITVTAVKTIIRGGNQQ